MVLTSLCPSTCALLQACNIMFKSDTSVRGFTAKVADFGLAIQLVRCWDWMLCAGQAAAGGGPSSRCLDA